MEISLENLNNKTPIRPKMGVVNLMPISSNPILDTIEIKKQENPREKIEPIRNKKINFQTIISVAISLLGVSVGLFKLLKK